MIVSILAIVPFIVATPVFSQANIELSSAADEADKAAKAESLPEIKNHLQCVLNCLEGKGGKDYKEMDTCPYKGKGALDTLPEHSANRIRSEKVISLIRVGITLHDYKPSHYLALTVHAILTEELE